MKTANLLAALACVALSAPPVNAAPPAAEAHQHEHGDTSLQHGADANGMMARAQAAKSPAERRRLMAENMAMMKDHMVKMNGMMDMGGMMDGKSMPVPMPMDAAHMEMMHQHMAMMHDMMERLMIQQELMMREAK
jgi:hypothetical protein